MVKARILRDVSKVCAILSKPMANRPANRPATTMRERRSLRDVHTLETLDLPGHVVDRINFENTTPSRSWPVIIRNRFGSNATAVISAQTMASAATTILHEHASIATVGALIKNLQLFRNNLIRANARTLLHDATLRFTDFIHAINDTNATIYAVRHTPNGHTIRRITPDQRRTIPSFDIRAIYKPAPLYGANYGLRNWAIAHPSANHLYVPFFNGHMLRYNYGTHIYPYGVIFKRQCLITAAVKHMLDHRATGPLRNLCTQRPLPLPNNLIAIIGRYIKDAYAPASFNAPFQAYT